MKTVTNDFKEQIAKLGREIDCKFSLHTNDKIITENGKFLMTQANQHLVVEQFDDTEVDEVINAEDIYSVSIVTRGKLLSTMMKELDFEVSHDLRIGDVIDCEFGVKVNDSYEYVNYGSYMVYSKEFNEDTKTFNYVAYDRMLLTMQEASQDFLTSLENKTLAYSMNTICDTVGLNFTATQEQLTEYPNLNKEINEGTFTDMQITYRDVLDMICQALGLSMIINPTDKHLLLKPLNNNIVDTFNEEYLKDTNVSFGKKYGPVNSVVLSRSEDTDNIYRRDEESIAENGLCEYKIKDNLIMLYDDREDYIDEIFNQLNGLEYYVTDFNSTGITYLDWLDFYNVTIGDKTYKCLMLNDEIKIEQGLEESIYCEEPEETVTPYKTSSKTDKEVSFIVDKQNGKINAKVSQDDIIASLNVAIEDGQGIVNLKGNTVTIDSDNFQLQRDGTVEITGGDIHLVDTGTQGYLSSLEIESNRGKTSIYSNGYNLRSNKNGISTFADDGTHSGINCYSSLNNYTYNGYLYSYNDTDTLPYCQMYLERYNDTTLERTNKIFLKIVDDECYGRMERGSNYIEQFVTNNLSGMNFRDDTGLTYVGADEIRTPNLYVSGSKNRVVEIDNGKKVCLGAYETATPYFGDIGSNKTDKDGVCKIEIENIFSQTIETDDYKVFIQECGDGRLYVEKHDNYFLVKGTPNLDFDWEIKAIQKGYKDVRLKEMEERK